MTERARQLLAQFRRESAADALGAYLRRQRWFAGRGREVSEVVAVEATPIRDGPELALWSIVVRVAYAEGAADHYHLLLSRRPVADAVTTVEGDLRLVAVVEDEGAPVAICDALHDPAALAELWQAIAAEERHPGVEGELRCLNLRMERDGGPVDPAGIHPLAREQSNTSAVREERELLKCIRRVAPGVSAELEVVDALARAGFERVAAPLGAVELHPAGGGEPTLLAIVQPFLQNATEGWTLALTSLRGLYADVEEMSLPGAEEPHAAPPADRPATTAASGLRPAASPAGVEVVTAEPTPGVEVGGFAPEAGRLGRVTAEMHLAALRIGPDADLVAHPVTPEHLDAWASEMTFELDTLLAGDDPVLTPLRARRPSLVAAFDEVRGLHGGMAIRIHGDYHLGQTLRTDHGWTVIDFEGEPNLPLPERRRRSSALRDVAGMMRSFDYAAAAALAERMSPADPQWPSMEPLGDAWAAADRAAFWEAYAATVEGSGLLPEGDEALVLLRAFELRKAVYETGYELGHRPEWTVIPIRFLLAGGPP